MSPLHEAELDYEVLCLGTPGVSRAEVDLDLMRFGLIATACAEATRKTWREYRSTHDPSSRTEVNIEQLALQVVEVLYNGLGMTQEAAKVLDEMVKAEF